MNLNINLQLREVRKIAILDILMLNCDRNEGNILVKRERGNRMTLIPIDHGLCLPDCIDICTYFYSLMGARSNSY